MSTSHATSATFPPCPSSTTSALAQLAFLTPGLAGPDAAADDHRIIGHEEFSSSAGLQLAGGDRGAASQCERGKREQPDYVFHLKSLRHGWIALARAAGIDGVGLGKRRRRSADRQVG